MNEISRRSLIAGAAGTVGATALTGPVFATPRPEAAPRTAIVIGSGFGGAVAALRLGRAGVRTTVFERGRRWPIRPDGNTFCTINRPDGRAAYFGDHTVINPLTNFLPIPRFPGLIEKIEGKGMDAIFGAGVGGGSLAFGAFTPQPRRADFEAVYPRGMSWLELDRTYYPRARAMLQTSPLPEDLLGRRQYKGARAWLAYIKDFGGEAVRHDFCIDWDVVRAEIAGDVVASTSVGEGPYGTNSGSKNSVDHTYLPAAEATGNVTIKPLHEVLDIRERRGRAGYEVTVRQIDEHRRELSRFTASADLLIMAAGSFHSTSLLVSAKARGGLPRLNGHVGEGFGTNGDFLMSRTPLRRDVGSAQGGPGVAVMYDDDAEGGPVSISWEATPFPRFAGGFTMQNLIQTTTDERGEVRYDEEKRTGVLHYPHPRYATKVDHTAARFAKKFHQRTEARFGYPTFGLPLFPGPVIGFGTAVTWHALGGLVMGKAASLDGELHGHRGLFVVDGAFLPGTSALVNPSLTITAIAERTMDRLVRRLG